MRPVRWLYAVAMLIGCRSTDSGPTTQVIAYAGDTAIEAGTTVISHRADGSLIDQQATDGAGHAAVGYEAGAYITVLYTRDTGVQLITAPALAIGTLVIHGPTPTRAPILAGTLVITAVPIAADAYSIDLGCIALPEPALPMYTGINAHCLGHDPNIDVVVEATNGGALVGYVATRVRVDTGVGTLDIPSWTTTPIELPIQNAPGASITLFEVSDGFAYATPAATAASAFAWDGLIVETTRVRAVLGTPAASQITTQYLAGLPTSIALTAAEFLPAPTTALGFDGASRFAWTAFGIGDVTHLHASWTTTTWDAVLDPTTAAIAIPQLGADLGVTTPGSDLATNLRAIDGPDTLSFAEVQAAGIYVEATAGASIVPPPVVGDVREASVVGFH
ncbi:hypothetical protein BH11MYX1_BH11MYX1_50610 [soil metagenome]